MIPAIRLDEIEFSYGGHQVLSRFSLSLETGQVLALQPLHDQIRAPVRQGAAVVQAHDVRVLEPRRDAHLTLEALHVLGDRRGGGMDDLERHLAGHPQVLGLVDGAHSAAPQGSQDPIAVSDYLT